MEDSKEVLADVGDCLKSYHKRYSTKTFEYFFNHPIYVNSISGLHNENHYLGSLEKLKVTLQGQLTMKD